MWISQRTSRILISIALFAIAFGIYYPSLAYEFLSWDTRQYVLESPLLRSLAWADIGRMFISFYMGNWHPLVWLSYAIDYAAYGLNPWGFHFTNTVFHSANTVLFFMLSLQLLKLYSATQTAAFSSTQQFWIASLAALWFGIHPQHIESVVWIAERKDVLSLFFSLLSLIIYINYAHTRRVRSYLLSLLCCYLALLAKPMAVTLPVVLLLLDIYPLKRTSFTGLGAHCESMLRIFWEKLPFFLGSAVSAVLTLLAQQAAMASIEQINFAMRLVNTFNSIIFYLSKFLFPLTLSPFYPFDLDILNNPFSLVAVLAVFALFNFALYAWYKRQFIWLSMLLFYLITLFPVLGIVQVGSQAAADRYAYFPTLPFYLVLAVGCSLWLFHKKILQRSIAVLGILLISGSFTFLNLQQQKIWENDLIFWAYIVSYHPDTTLAQANLATAYYQRGHYSEAIEHYKIALQYTNDGMMYYNLAQAYVKVGDFKNALDIYQSIITYKVNIGVSFDKLYYHVGYSQLQLAHYAEARQALQEALRLNPNLEVARERLKQLPATFQ